MQTTCVNCGKIYDQTEHPSECPACGWNAAAPPSAPPPPPAETPDPFGSPTEPEPFGGNPFTTSGPAAGAAPPTTSYQPPPKQGMSSTAKVLIAVGVGLAVLLIGVVIAAVVFFNRVTDVVAEEGGADFFGGTAVSDLEVGDCYDAANASVVVPCDEVHTHEVFGLIPWTQGSGYPSELDVFSEIYCEDLFEAYVGIDYFESVLWYETARPSESSWDAGDRDIRCVLYEPGVTLRQSEFGSAR